MIAHLVVVLFVLHAASSAEAQNFSDGFSSDHDFLASGMAGSGWDGFLGKGERETADRIEVADGKLYLQSTHGRYQEGWDPLGPLLYKSVGSDFKATVRVVDHQSVSYNNCGIMARVADLDVAGKGEDWISIDYFPGYGGVYARMADDNKRNEKSSNGQGRSADKYLQMELVGNLFFLRHSPDGVSWTELPDSPLTRNDLVNVELQVGLFQATYSGNQGEVSFDDFSLELGATFNTARIGLPMDGAPATPTALTLSWIPGSGARQHDLYFGTSLADVENATADKGNGVYRGRQEFAEYEHDLSHLQDAQTYYWRVDEIAGDQIQIGQVWSFTVYDRNLEDFESYKSDRDLSAEWHALGATQVSLAQEGAQTGRQSLELTSAAGVPAQMEFTFNEEQDWLSSVYSFRFLRVHFKGDSNNQAAKLQLALEDGAWGEHTSVVEYEGLPANLTNDAWTRWDIDLGRFVTANPAFRLDQVKQLRLSLEGAGHSSRIAIDSISIQYRRGSGTDAWPRYIQPSRFVDEVPFTQVTVTGGLWAERMEVNRTVSLPHVWGRCETSKKGNGEASLRLDNFRKAAGEIPGGFTGTFFNDSDVYKIIEGTAYSLANHPDAELEAYTDKVIDSIAGAQWEDGYLFTFYSLPKRQPNRRWSNVGSMHELYCAGHMFEAAVAYHQTTGKRKLLDVAIKFADLICETFGPGKLDAAPGHQEIEIALMKLYHATDNQRYMDMAKFFIDQRGDEARDHRYGTYSQDHVPFVEQEKGVGHSVRAGYLYCAATDIVAVNQDEAYANTLFKIWDNVTNTKTYITGGIGQPGGPEGFAGDYELGNGCYAETCSGIAFSLWNHRLHQLTGESKYADLIERTFLNNMLSSLSAVGDRHYYTNPLASGGRDRWEWPGHDCACCPSNLVRVISSISGYTYTHSGDTINVNQYLESDGTVELANNAVGLIQTTRYPWDGDIAIEVRPERQCRFRIRLRIPGWARDQPMPGNLYRYLDETPAAILVSVNGKTLDASAESGYLTIEREWKAGDTIRLNLPMRIRRIIAHPKATADKGRVAIERGPIVYCAENADNDFHVGQLILADSSQLEAKFDPELFGGAVTLTSNGSPGLKLIPYYLHSNRKRGWMHVWLRRE